MASVENLEDLLQDEVKDLYDAEKQLAKALPKLAKKATAGELKEALQSHLEETQGHIERLDQAFELLEMPARGKKCKGMQNLIAEGDEMIGEVDAGPTRDALIIAAAQKCEHYEIASYGTVRVWANLLGKTDVAELFEETLNEEKSADQKLTAIAESSINEEAAEEKEEGEEPEVQRGRGRQAQGGVASTRRSAAADRTVTKGRAR
jgi:ferritin-like metal-binding protein YciE